MGFTLGVENAPEPATQWMASCNYYSTGIPGMTDQLLLSQRWNCPDPAPGENWLGIVFFDAEGSIVQESAVEVTIEDRGNYIFDFATETLRVVTAAGCLPLVIIGLLVVLGVGAAVACALA